MINKKVRKRIKRAFGRVWFMAFVLKTITLQKVVSSNLTVPVFYNIKNIILSKNNKSTFDIRI
jgi:hypothetical protein